MDTDDIVALVRLVMGSISTSTMPDSIVNHYVVIQQGLYTEDCRVIYHSIVDCYGWLIAQAHDEASGGGSRQETNGPRTIKVGDYDKSYDYQDALDDFLENPTRYLPECQAILEAMLEETGLNRIIVGGVDEETIRTVQQTRRTGGASEVSGVAGSPFDGLVSRDGFTIYRQR